jgi:hypothetical protein
MGGREVIVQLGDRRNSGFCLMCGTNLIEPWNDYQCCTKCTGVIKGNLAALKTKQMGGVKTGSFVITKDKIARQVAPLGEPVD